jgi:hypothetical protein
MAKSAHKKLAAKSINSGKNRFLILASLVVLNVPATVEKCNVLSLY